MEILNFEEQATGSKIVATFDVVVPALGMTLRRWKLMRGKNGRVFPCSPSFSLGEAPNKQWFQYVEINEKRRADFNKAVMDALEPFRRPDW